MEVANNPAYVAASRGEFWQLCTALRNGHGADCPETMLAAIKGNGVHQNQCIKLLYEKGSTDVMVETLVIAAKHAPHVKRVAYIAMLLEDGGPKGPFGGAARVYVARAWKALGAEQGDLTALRKLDWADGSYYIQYLFFTLHVMARVGTSKEGIQ